MASEQHIGTPEERIKQLEAQLEFTHTHYQKLFEQVQATVIQLNASQEVPCILLHTLHLVQMSALPPSCWQTVNSTPAALIWQVDGAALLSDVEHVPHARHTSQHDAASIGNNKVLTLDLPSVTLRSCADRHCLVERPQNKSPVCSVSSFTEAFL